MKVNTTEALKRLVANAVPEGPSLEYKSSLSLSGRKQRVELLKDITGMGNGGGGTLIYGVSEKPEDDGVPDAVVPLNDRGIVGAVEDLARTGVRSPLLMDISVLDVDSGFVMVVDVEKSALGPYMIQILDERRYYKRVGSRTTPMDEQEVRDAYTLASRVRELQRDRWDIHGLPIPVFPDAPWLSIAAVPRIPAHDIFDPKDFSDLRKELGSGDIESFLPWASRTDLGLFDDRMGIWSGGIHAEIIHRQEPPRGLLRLHRDGSAGIVLKIEGQQSVWALVYDLNVYLFHVGRLWRRIGLRGPVELEIHLRNLAELSLFDDPLQPETAKTLQTPPFAHDPEVHLTEEVLVDDLVAPSARHSLLRLFADRVEQAFGHRGDDGYRFEWGWLYRPGQNFLGISVEGGALWDERGGEVAVVDELGCVWSNAGDLVAHADRGLIIDREVPRCVRLTSVRIPGCPWISFLTRLSAPSRLEHGKARNPARGATDRSELRHRLASGRRRRSGQRWDRLGHGSQVRYPWRISAASLLDQTLFLEAEDLRWVSHPDLGVVPEYALANASGGAVEAEPCLLDGGIDDASEDDLVSIRWEGADALEEESP